VHLGKLLRVREVRGRADAPMLFRTLLSAEPATAGAAQAWMVRVIGIASTDDPAV
jgi:hypothetical protein